MPWRHRTWRLSPPYRAGVTQLAAPLLSLTQVGATRLADGLFLHAQVGATQIAELPREQDGRCHLPHCSARNSSALLEAGAAAATLRGSGDKPRRASRRCRRMPKLMSREYSAQRGQAREACAVATPRDMRLRGSACLPQGALGPLACLTPAS